MNTKNSLQKNYFLVILLKNFVVFTLKMRKSQKNSQKNGGNVYLKKNEGKFKVNT